jgi:prevent-host-death family protein
MSHPSEQISVDHVSISSISTFLYNALTTMPQIDVEQAKRDFDRLLERASQGEEVVITKNNQPLARLTAPSSFPKREKRQFGSVEGDIWMSDDFDEPLDDVRECME